MAFLPEVKDFDFEVATGGISGKRRVGFGGSNPGVTANREETVSNLRLETGTGGPYPYLSADTQLYVSSSSASDTGCVIVVGVDSNFIDITRFATLNGQTPVALSGDMFRVFVMDIFTDDAAVGNVYFSKDNLAITNGVPDNLSDVLGKIDSGNKSGFLPNFTIPANTSAYLQEFQPNSSKVSDAAINLRFRFGSGDFSSAPNFEAFQNSSTFQLKMGFVLPAGLDVDLTMSSPTDGARATVAWTVILTDI